eukprot:s5621_g1.t1
MQGVLNLRRNWQRILEDASESFKYTRSSPALDGCTCGLSCAMSRCVKLPYQDEGPAMVATYTEKLMSLGLEKPEIQKRFCEMRALQSERAGVSIGYLLSGEFTQLATDRSGKDDPTFIDTRLTSKRHFGFQSIQLAKTSSARGMGRQDAL